MNPNTQFELPLYALPDLVSMGPCWLYAITKRHNSIYETRYYENHVLGGEEMLDQDQIVPGPQANVRRRRGRHQQDPFDEDEVHTVERHPAEEVHDESDEGVPGLPINASIFENNPNSNGAIVAVVSDDLSTRQNVQENSQNHCRKKNQVLIRKSLTLFININIMKFFNAG
jgi:hypothetical protein